MKTWWGLALSGLVMSACAVGDDRPVAEICADPESGGWRAFEDVEPTLRYGELAADFTVNTLDGQFTLSEVYDGCSSVVMIAYAPTGYHDQLWANELWGLVTEDAPSNVHYVFASHLDDASQRQSQLEFLKGQFDSFLGQMSAEERKVWKDQLHYVTDDAGALGWPSQMGASNFRRTFAYHGGERFVGLLVDRFQRIRPIGEALDWVTSSINMSRMKHHAEYFNFEAERADRMSREDALEVTIFDNTDSGSGWNGPGVFTTAEIPDLSEYNQLFIDLEMGCHHVGDDPEKEIPEGAYVGDLDCPEWDRITTLYMCDELEATEVNEETGEIIEQAGCNTEIGRWITAYTGGANYVHDVTPMLAHFSEDMVKRFRYTSIDNYPITLKLRAVNNPDIDVRPTQLIELYSGGTLTNATNDRYEPMDVEIPASAKKVEVAAVITGHSFGKETKNCAEFCNMEHHFMMNGNQFSETHEIANDSYGCLGLVSEGVVPNQFGSWQFGRAGWCPGQEVTMWRQDVTGVLDLGSTNNVDYGVTVDGTEYEPVWFDPETGGIWEGEGEHPAGIWVPEYKMSSWLVVYE